MHFYGEAQAFELRASAMDKKKGIVYLTDVERDPVEIELSEDSVDHPWIRKAIEEAAPTELEMSATEWADACKLKGSMRVERLGGEYMLSGDFKADVQGLCSRCGDGFPTKRDADVRLFFEPSKKSKFIQPLMDGGDPDYIILENDRIELAPLLTEQILVQVPVAECPKRGEDGTCNFCGKNPQFAGQGDENGEVSSPFSKLKDLAGRL